MKLPRKHWIWLTALLAVVAIAAFACGDDDDDGGDDTDETPAPTATPPSEELKTDFGVTDTEIKLGLTIVGTGNLAAVYQPVAPSMQAYFKKVNEEDGGVCDRQINLLVEDDQYSPAVGLEVAKKLVEQEQILAFTGNLGTPPVTGQVQYINDQGVPHLFVSTGASKWGDYETYPWTIGYIPDYINEGRILATYANDNFAGQSAAILSQNDDFGGNGRDGFKELFEGEIVAEQTYESTATDINQQLAALRAANPDILYLYSTPAFTARAYGYMAANNWSPQVIMSYVNSASTLASLVGGGTAADQIAAGFEAIAGAISTNYLLDPVADADDPAMVEHARIMSEYGGPPVGNLSVYGQSLAELVVETLEIACENNDMTRAGVLAAAESIKDFSTSLLLPGISITLGPEDHYALQALMPVEIQSDGTLLALADEPISVE